MKKFSLLKKLCIGLGPVAIVTPLFFSATSCSSENAILANYISYDTFLNDESLEHMKHGRFDNDDLLLGSKKFFNGNYILLIGSNAYPTDSGDASLIQKFFGSTESRDVKSWFANIHNSVWYRDVQTVDSGSLKLNRDFGFVTYIDNFDFHFYDKNHHEFFVVQDSKKRITLQNFGPFDKWSKELISQSRDFEYKDGYKWDAKEKVTESDYIRQDASAKAFRAFMARGASMFPTTDKRTKTFDTAEGNKASIMAVYKDGKLVDIIDMPIKEKDKDDPEDKETTTLYGTINKYFTDEEDED